MSPPRSPRPHPFPVQNVLPCPELKPAPRSSIAWRCHLHGQSILAVVCACVRRQQRSVVRHPGTWCIVPAHGVCETRNMGETFIAVVIEPLRGPGPQRQYSVLRADRSALLRPDFNQRRGRLQKVQTSKKKEVGAGACQTTGLGGRWLVGLEEGGF